MIKYKTSHKNKTKLSLVTCFRWEGSQGKHRVLARHVSTEVSLCPLQITRCCWSHMADTALPNPSLVTCHLAAVNDYISGQK